MDNHLKKHGSCTGRAGLYYKTEGGGEQAGPTEACAGFGLGRKAGSSNVGLTHARVTRMGGVGPVRRSWPTEGAAQTERQLAR